MQIPRGAYDATIECHVRAGLAGIRHFAVELLEKELASFGYSVAGVDDDRDPDISWVELRNIGKCVVQIGIIEPDQSNKRLHVILYPPLPYVRVWFRRVSTRALIERLGHAVSSILEGSGKFSDSKRLDRNFDPVPEEALFVVADEPLLVFPSAAIAERALEPLDVSNGVYGAAYDRHGLRYRIVTRGRSVNVEPIEDASSPRALEELLRSYLETVGLPPSGPTTLDELVARAWAIGRQS